MHVVATAGHVDHGKSTLVRALTGRDPDRLAEERRRGLTIALGYAWMTLPSGEQLAFVDVPGHERFVATMLAGVGPVPAVLFVVAADEGWKPQSEEHLDALNALGVRHGVLAVTRSDLADPARAATDSRTRIARTTLGSVPWVAVSGTTGRGLPELRAALDDMVALLPTADPAADVRLWVDRCFSVRGAGTVVTGTLPAGTVCTGDQLETVPGRCRVRVRGLEMLDRAADAASGTARVALNLRGIDHAGLPRGVALVTPGAFLDVAVLDVALHRCGDDLLPTAPLPHRRGDGSLPTALMLHVGAATRPVQVRPLGDGAARITLAESLPLRIGDRLLLRDPGRHVVVAGATVLDVLPPPLRRRGAAAARGAELALRSGASDAAAEITRRGMARDRDLRAMGAPPDAPPMAGGWHLSAAVLGELRDQVSAAVEAYAGEHPLEPGMSADALVHVLALPDARLLPTVLPEAYVVRDGRVASAVWADDLPDPVAAAVRVIAVDLAMNPWAAPDSARLDELGLGRRELAAAVRIGALLNVTGGVYLLPGADEQAAARLAALPQPFTVSDARQELATSRRVAVPLLEMLDRQGRTHRLPDGRRCLR